MPWSIFEKKSTDNAEWSGFLDQGTRLEGKLESSGTLRLDTHVNGSIRSEATLILGEHAQGKGDLTAGSVFVAGHFDGVIRAHHRVDLRPTAVVIGEIHTPSLAIEPGAIFEGECHVTAPKEADKPIIVRIRASTRTE